MTRLPALAAELLSQIPLNFRDDGCSNSPDTIYGCDLRWACRLHDWWWCTRAHPEDLLDDEWKDAGDHILGLLVRSALPQGLRWVGDVYLRAVQRYGSSYDTCGHNGELCRHALPRPAWMAPKERAQVSRGEPTVVTIADVDWDAEVVASVPEENPGIIIDEHPDALLDDLIPAHDDEDLSGEPCDGGCCVR